MSGEVDNSIPGDNANISSNVRSYSHSQQTINEKDNAVGEMTAVTGEQSDFLVDFTAPTVMGPYKIASKTGESVTFTLVPITAAGSENLEIQSEEGMCSSDDTDFLQAERSQKR